MATPTNRTRAESQGRAAALTVRIDDEAAAALARDGFTTDWVEQYGEQVGLPENPYPGGALADAWRSGFMSTMASRRT